MRLQHFLAIAGVASRRQCEKLITAGRVAVNGVIVRQLGSKVDPVRDRVEFDGKRVRVETQICVVLNKPPGYLSSVGDTRGRRTVSELVADIPVRLYPVGRLDFDTAGVLLMTNDGPLCHRLTHPRFAVEKTYRAEVEGKPSALALKKLEKGIDIGEAVTSPAKARLIRSDRARSTVEITVHEGRKRQIKRMCAAIGHPVQRLTRVKFAGIGVGGLKAGEYRVLKSSEVAALRRLVLLEDGAPTLTGIDGEKGPQDIFF